MRAVVPLDGFPRAGVVADDWSDTVGPRDLLSGARLLGARVWVERELHRVIGGWVRTAGDATAVFADRVAMGHGRRSEILFARLPQLRELPSDLLVVSPGQHTDAVIGCLEQLVDDHGRLAGWSVVADELVRVYESELRRCTPVADAPLLRCLPLLLDELSSDRAAVDSVAGYIHPSGEGPIASLLGASDHLTA